MKNKKNKIQAFLALICLGVIAGCGTTPLFQEESTIQREEAFPQLSKESSPVVAASAEDCGETYANESAYGEQFKIYEPFGMTYDAAKNELYYKGKAVRWFEDYYPLGEDTKAGKDFFNENGVIDVHAVRDLHTSQWSADGSFDPGGTLTGLAEFSEEEFAARDLEDIRNPAPPTAIAGDPPSKEELLEMEKEYAPFGMTYDAGEEQ